jgi:hypothetical protein
LELIPTNRDSNTKKYKEMKINTQTEGYTVPYAFVTKGRQRVKQYGVVTNNPTNGIVYLNNGDEFEIELFNPTRDKVMAKVDLNGTSIGPGIVLNPGQRVYLERYINEAKKFLYMTYEVDGGNADVQRAIANNGDVSIKFYVETPPPQPVITWSNPWWSHSTVTPFYGYTHTTNSCNFMNSNPPASGIKSGSVTGAANGGSSTLTSSFNPSTKIGAMKGRKLSKSINPQNFAGGQGESSLGFAEFGASFETIDSAPDVMCRSFAAEPEKTIETGRIEKGSNSNQSFGRDYSTFNTYWSWKTEWKILPLSQKPVEVQDMVLYCTGCQRRRRKQTDIFCPKCGKRY